MLTIVRVGPDPFDRGELTVFYRDSSVNGGKDVFYLWASHWRHDHPTIPVPPDGYDSDPVPPPKPLLRSREPGRCIPYVLRPQV